MQKTIGGCVLALALAGCGPEFEMRKDPDLQHIDPRRAAALRNIRIDRDYSARVAAPSSWQVLSSLDNLPALTDGDIQTVAVSTDEHRKGEWILIDLGCVCHFQNVRQLHPPGVGAPPGYRVDTAGDHGFPFTLEYVGVGEPGASTATFPRAVDARFIRITIVEDGPKPWGVAEIEVF